MTTVEIILLVAGIATLFTIMTAAQMGGDGNDAGCGCFVVIIVIWIIAGILIWAPIDFSKIEINGTMQAILIVAGVITVLLTIGILNGISEGTRDTFMGSGGTTHTGIRSLTDKEEGNVMGAGCLLVLVIWAIAGILIVMEYHGLL